MKRGLFTGLGVALITPFDENQEVDFNALDKILDHITPHVDYLVVFGTTGESVTLTKKEKADIISHIKKHSSNITLVYGYGGNNTQKLVEEVPSVNWEGISAVLSVSPYYNRPSQSGIIKHYEKLADHLPRPLLLYNVPGRTGSNINSDTTVTLSTHPNIMGTKEASGNIDQISKVISNSPDDFLVISGDDMLTPEILQSGGNGLISVLANAYPAEFKKGIESHFSGNHDQCVNEFSRFDQLNPLMYQEGSPSGVKELMAQLDLCKNIVRLPMDQVSESLRESIKAHKL